MVKETPKLDLDLQIMVVTLKFKPWKGKVNALVTTVLIDGGDLIKSLEETIQDIKQRGKHKRRTITEVSFRWGAKL